MAKGVKKIKWVGETGVLKDFSVPDKILCIKPNQEAPFAVGEWYNETTEEEKRNSIKWLWMDQRKKIIFHKTIKLAGVPFGVTLPKKLCGSYAFYLEASLYGRHDHRNTGLHVYGKCEKKIISSSWSKKENTADNSEIIYGHDLFVTLEAEGINGDTLTFETYSVNKTDKAIETIPAKCVNGILKAKFKTMSCYISLSGLPDNFENFYIKVLEITGDYIKNANGSDKVFSFTIKNERVMPVFEPPTNTTPLKVDDPPKEEEAKTEGIITAYFAKEEFSLETSEIAGQHKYIFQTKNIGIDKDKVAKIIKDRVDAQVKADRKYAKLEDIKNSLENDSYDIGTFVSFNLCKLGANYIKINSAPLEEEVYVVAKTFLLDGKEITIKIKEKETILVDADADVPVLEAKEDGGELTILKATVENGLAKVKIKLRPKTDEDLKAWKEKLLKGKKGEAYSYTFKTETVITDSNKKQFATIILNNAKEGKQGNTKIETGKTAFAEDIEKALESKTYISGSTISFDIYKTQAENLWLQAECQGNTIKHEGEFLKKDGEYFVIGKKCDCEARVRAFIRMLRVGEGTEGEKGYTRQFSGKQFSDMSDHPHEVITASGYSSSAAGAYQIMANTYDELKTYRTKYNILNFNQESQDKLCLVILKHNYEKDRPSSFYNPIYWKDKAETIRNLEKENIAKERRKRFKGQNGDIIKMLIDNNFDNAVLLSALCWASLPDAPYGQPTETKKECKANYEKFFKEELEEKSDLYLKKGFLKEFGYSCGCNVESNDTCPDDFSQCFNYADVWDNPEISSDNGGKNNNRYGYNTTRGHKGIDILSGPSYKDVHSLMCGTVGKIVDSFKTNEYKEHSLGNTLMIKSKDKGGNEIFILYCHLDEIYVQEGDKVKHGQKVAKSGSTGNASYSGLPNGVKGHGIEKENWHCHIEAATKGEGSNNFYYLGSYRVKAEDYMKTKFDNNGERI